MEHKGSSISNESKTETDSIIKNKLIKLDSFDSEKHLFLSEY